MSSFELKIGTFTFEVAVSDNKIVVAYSAHAYVEFRGPSALSDWEGFTMKWAPHCPFCETEEEAAQCPW